MNEVSWVGVSLYIATSIFTEIDNSTIGNVLFFLFLVPELSVQRSRADAVEGGECGGGGVFLGV